MRIIINIDECRDDKGQRAIRVRTGYSFNSGDKIRVMNCGVELYNIIKDGFGSGFQGGVVIHEGERR